MPLTPDQIIDAVSGYADPGKAGVAAVAMMEASGDYFGPYPADVRDWMQRYLTEQCSYARIQRAASYAMGVFPFLGNRLIGYTSGKRAFVASGSVSGFAMVGASPALSALGGPTVSTKVVAFDGIDDTAIVPPTITKTATLDPDKVYNLPEASGSTGNGFTCTGGSDYPLLPNAFVAGNHAEGNPALTSIVICQFVNGVIVKKDEFLMSDYAAIITTPGSIQGTTWVENAGKIGFNHIGMLKTYYIDPATRIMTASPGGSIATLNALAVDPEIDAILTGITGKVQFRDRATFTVVRTADGGADGLYYDVNRRENWRTAGPNGTDGALYIIRASAVPTSGTPTYIFTLGGVDAIEGVWRGAGQTIYVFNDAGFHIGGGRKNQLFVFTLPPLDSAPRWPIGQTVQFFGRLRQPAISSATTRVVAGVANSLSTGLNGIAMFIPNAILTTLRIIVGNTPIDWTGIPSLSTARDVFATVSPRAGTAELWIDGVSMGVQSFTAQPLFWSDPSPMYLASNQGIDRFWPGEMSAFGMAVDSAANQAAIMAAMALDIAT